MAKTLWDINFSTLDTTATDYNGWGSKVTNYKNMATGVYNPSGTKLAVNAVDIDWNGAQLSLPEELNWGIIINILLAECIWSLETILNEKVHLTSGCTFAAKKGQRLF